jgi:hypothetical protein
MKLLGPDVDLFLKGRRSESQDLGIAAFSYYRRVVERQKDRLFDQLIRVSETVGVPKEISDGLKEAKKETQFTKAIGSLKPGVPESLLIDGHNPLLLLHSALSEGLHADTDEECLEIAHSIRVVLTELSERMASAVAEQRELKEAVSRLLRKHEQKKS